MAPQVGTDSGDSVEYSGVVAVHGERLAVDVDDGTSARFQLLDSVTPPDADSVGDEVLQHVDVLSDRA